MSNAIRLTNKTAKALRKTAARVRTAHFAAAALLSAGMTVLAVYLGLKWLPAVPMMVAAAVLLDCLIILRGKSRYLSLIGQAICTEAAAREIRAGRSESQRREKAITDLINAKADAQQRPSGGKSGAKPFFEPEQEHAQEEEETGSTQTDGVHMQRRRRQKGLKLIRN